MLISMTRPTLSRPDFNLRLFLDTNVIIDYIEGLDNQCAKSFIDSFKNSKFQHIELVTSDCVLWELYDYLRHEHYAKKMHCQNKCTFKTTKSGMETFKGITFDEMKEIKDEITKAVDNFFNNAADSVITLEQTQTQPHEYLYRVTELLLQTSKFSREDIIILISAMNSRTHILITIDDQFKGEGKERISILKKEYADLPIHWEMDFASPMEFLREGISKKYKEWFLSYNQDKVIGNVIKVYPNEQVIAVECSGDYCLKENDFICIIKFVDGVEFEERIFKINRGNLYDYDEEKPISSGKKVTIKNVNPEVLITSNLENSTVFLLEY